MQCVLLTDPSDILENCLYILWHHLDFYLLHCVPVEPGSTLFRAHMKKQHQMRSLQGKSIDTTVSSNSCLQSLNFLLAYLGRWPLGQGLSTAFLSMYPILDNPLQLSTEPCLCEFASRSQCQVFFLVSPLSFFVLGVPFMFSYVGV